MKAPQSSASSFGWISGCAVLFIVAAVILPLIGPILYLLLGRGGARA